MSRSRRSSARPIPPRRHFAVVYGEALTRTSVSVRRTRPRPPRSPLCGATVTTRASLTQPDGVAPSARRTRRSAETNRDVRDPSPARLSTRRLRRRTGRRALTTLEPDALAAHLLLDGGVCRGKRLRRASHPRRRCRFRSIKNPRHGMRTAAGAVHHIELDPRRCRLPPRLYFITALPITFCHRDLSGRRRPHRAGSSHAAAA